ncbi:MAG: glycosyltransferase [Candidatus Aenigmarchaeota archaeon]|nr:glycosyltransferase [Candidatus Aenigmarchaeota archaeon]
MRIIVSHSKAPWSLGDYCMRALAKLGHEIIPHDYLASAHKYGLPGHAVSKLVLGDALPNRRLLSLAKKEKPDLVLVLKGEVLEPFTIESLKKRGIKTANWCMDSPFHPLYSSPKVARSIRLYDSFFTPVKDMEKRLMALGFDNARFLPFACDPEIHKPAELSGAEHEAFGSNLCFVGTYYPEREALLSGLERFGLKIWGNEWQNCESESLKKSATMRPANGQNMSRVFTASKIAIGTHQEQSMGSLTMRAFEAPACGGFMLVDDRPDLRLFYAKNEMASYRTKKEMLNLIDYYLRNEKERKTMAQRARKKAIQKHTYVHRIKQMLKDLE